MKRKNLEAAIALCHEDPQNEILDQSRMLPVEDCSDKQAESLYSKGRALSEAISKVDESLLEAALNKASICLSSVLQAFEHCNMPVL